MLTIICCCSVMSVVSDTVRPHRWQPTRLPCPRDSPGNPLQCSCLENPRDEGAWWAAVYGVAQTRTRLKRLSSSSSLQRDFPRWQWLKGKESACDIGATGSIPGSGRSPGVEHSNPLQYSCLENPTDREAWRAVVHEVAKSQTQLKQLSIVHRMYKVSDQP